MAVFSLGGPDVIWAESSSPLSILKQARTVQIPESGVAGRAVPQPEPRPVAPTPVAVRPTPSDADAMATRATPASSSQKVPEYEQDRLSVGEQPAGTTAPAPDNSVSETPAAAASEPAVRATPRKPGLVKRVIRAVPFIGPRVMPPSERPPRPTPADESTDGDAAQQSADRQMLMRDIETLAAGSAPQLYAPPGEESTQTTGTAATPATRTAPPIDQRAVQTPAKTPASAAPTISVRPKAPARTVTPPPRLTPVRVEVGVPLAAAAPLSPAADTPERAIRTPGVTPVATPTPATEQMDPTPVANVQTPIAQPAATATPAPSLAEVTTSPSLESTDLAMPNPSAEENEVIRQEFIGAVNAGRAGQYADASRKFRDYAANHPSSQLAPRALFLSAVMATSFADSALAAGELRKLYKSSPYVRELDRRGVGKEASPQDLYQMTAAYEQELAADASGGKSLAKRIRLATLYVRQADYVRALQTLEPAADAARGRAEEPEILDLISECRMGQGMNPEAMVMMDELLRRFPTYRGRPRIRLNLGLVNEAEGNYQRAVAEYKALLTESPASAEAQMAKQRVEDLMQLSE